MNRILRGAPEKKKNEGDSDSEGGEGESSKEKEKKPSAAEVKKKETTLKIKVKAEAPQLIGAPQPKIKVCAHIWLRVGFLRFGAGDWRAEAPKIKVCTRASGCSLRM
jgi:hypothetical protein